MTASRLPSLCVYASSSDEVDEAYVAAARELGLGLVDAGYELVYGAGGIGLMGVVARAVHEKGGRMMGVIPEKLHALGLAYEEADELIITESMSERKAAMAARGDAFVALPGGLGTLEEIAEVLVLKQLAYHEKPVIFLNIEGFYDHLIGFIEHQIATHFVKPDHRELYYVAPNVAAVFDHLRDYQPPRLGGKWFGALHEMKPE